MSNDPDLADDEHVSKTSSRSARFRLVLKYLECALVPLLWFGILLFPFPILRFPDRNKIV